MSNTEEKLTPVGFRLPDRVIARLSDASSRSGLTKTDLLVASLDRFLSEVEKTGLVTITRELSKKAPARGGRGSLRAA